MNCRITETWRDSLNLTQCARCGRSEADAPLYWSERHPVEDPKHWVCMECWPKANAEVDAE